jgi:hypothetical protein
MPNECCGKPVETPFCPLCGKKNGPCNAIHELLRQVRITQECQLSRAVGLADMASRDERYQRGSDAANKAVEKWKRWGDALEELIAQVQPKKEN